MELFCFIFNYLFKNEARFTSLISDIRLDMQYKMADNQSVQNPCVRLYSSMYIDHIYLYRIFESENKILIYENMHKKSDVFFIIIMMK
jgi:hypothetical protein